MVYCPAETIFKVDINVKVHTMIHVLNHLKSFFTLEKLPAIFMHFLCFFNVFHGPLLTLACIDFIYATDADVFVGRSGWRRICFLAEVLQSLHNS